MGRRKKGKGNEERTARQTAFRLDSKSPGLGQSRIVCASCFRPYKPSGPGRAARGAMNAPSLTPAEGARELPGSRPSRRESLRARGEPLGFYRSRTVTSARALNGAFDRIAFEFTLVFGSAFIAVELVGDREGDGVVLE